MATFIVTGPDGQNYEVSAPDNASEADILDYVRKSIGARQPGDRFTDNAGANWDGGDNFASGVLQGFGDEVKAATAAAKEAWVDGGLDFSEAYDQAKTAYQGARQDYNNRNPKMGVATDIAGQVAPWLIGGAAVAGAKALPKVTSTTGRMAAGGGVGAGIGGVSGFTNAEGEFNDRVEGAAEGSAIGLVTGALAAPVAELIGKVGKAGLQRVLNGVAGGFTRAEQKLANAIADMGGGDIKKGIAIVREKLSQGRGEGLVDVTGIQGQKLGRAVANVPGESAQMADDFVASRAAGRGERMQSAADNLAPRANIAQTSDDLISRRTKESRPIYRQTVNPENLIDDTRFAEIANDPFMMSVFKEVQEDTLLGMGQDATNSMPVVDAVKKRLDDMISAAQRAGEGNRARLLIEKRDALVRMADDAFPEYAAAREAWAIPTRLQDAMERGRKFLRSDADLTAKEIAAMSPDEQKMFQLGARKAISEMISSDTQSIVGRLADKKEALWSKIRAAFPDEKAFNAFRQEVMDEAGKMQTDRFVSPRAGSQTAGLKEDIAELGRTPSSAMDAVGHLATGNKLAALGSLLKGPYQKFSAPNQRTAKELADALFALDPLKQDAMIKQLDHRRVAEDVLPFLAPDRRKMLAGLLTRATAPTITSQSVHSQ